MEEEIEPSDTVAALESVMSVDEEINHLKAEADNLNSSLSTLIDDNDDSG